MAETSLQKYRRRIPQFASSSDDVINGWLTDASSALCAASFGSRYQDAVIYYAAHLQAVADISAQMAAGGPGSVLGYAGLASSVKEGDLTIALRAGSGNAQAQSMSDDFLALTIYGRQYAHIRDSTVPRLSWVRTDIRGSYPI